MSGAGNDFVVVDNRQNLITDHADFALHVCDRRWGVGADGLLLVEPDKSESYGMAYFNADGSYGGMCGNGGRCIALFAHLRGIAKPEHTFRALDHVYKATVSEETVSLRMKDPKRFRKALRIEIPEHVMTGHFIDTGSPHVVIFVEDLDSGSMSLDQIPVSTIGPDVRRHELFRDEGTNVNFVYIDSNSRCNIRTYERGVEAETLACGTGSIAAALVASELKGLKSPVTVVPASGKLLSVKFTGRGEAAREIELTGPAVITFEGTYDYGARR